jgi:hypothetical protein
MPQLLQRVYVLIDLSYFASGKGLSGVAVANAVQAQQDRDLSQTETCPLSSLHALQLFKRLRAVVSKAANTPRGLWQQAPPLVIAHRFHADARRLGKPADRYLRPRNNLH